MLPSTMQDFSSLARARRAVMVAWGEGSGWIGGRSLAGMLAENIAGVWRAVEIAPVGAM